VFASGFLSSLRNRRLVAFLFRRFWTRTSRTKPLPAGWGPELPGVELAERPSAKQTLEVIVNGRSTNHGASTARSCWANERPISHTSGLCGGRQLLNMPNDVLVSIRLRQKAAFLRELRLMRARPR
jgi:hypothetical protein